MPTLIRLATPADLPTLRLLFEEYAAHLAANPHGADSICLSDFAAELAGLPAPYTTLLLAEVDTQPAGCVALKPLLRPGEQACELKRLFVRPRFRGLSLGRQLLVAALDHATATGYTALYLDTVPAAMPEAGRLYTALGFQSVPRYCGNPVPGVVFFRRSLSLSASIEYAGSESC